MNSKITKKNSRSDDVSDEEYWLTSKPKGFNFDEDNADLQTAKKISSSVGGGVFVDDSTELINWDDSKVGSRSVRFVPSGETKPAVSQQRLSSNKPNFVKDSKLSGPSSTLEQHIENSAIRGSRAVSGSPPSTNVTGSDGKLRNKSVRAWCQGLAQTDYINVSPEDTVQRIISGHSYHLEPYKALQDKLALLDAAIKFHDGNSILVAVLFLRQTVKRSIFNREIMYRNEAVDQYVKYLTATKCYADLEDIIGMLGKIEESAMLKYKQAISSSNIETKKRNLQTCLRTHFQSSPGLSLETELVQEHISLIERQLPVEDADEKDEKEGRNQLFKEFPRVASITDMPVITTLYYCCFYHYDLSENSYASPLSIKKFHKLTEKQFLWTALSARSKLRRWKDVQALFMVKGMFGGSKMKSPIGFDKVVDVLMKTGSPSDILSQYTRLIDDQDLKLEIALKCKCHDVVIDTFVAMKDRSQIETYKAKMLEPHTQEFYYAQNALSNSSIKWKN